MNIELIEEKLNILEKNARINLSVVKEIRKLLINKPDIKSTNREETDFNIPGLLTDLVRGVKNNKIDS